MTSVRALIVYLALCGLAAALRERAADTPRCSCGQPIFSGLCYEAKDGSQTPCCGNWASECPATSPLMTRGLDVECNFQPFQRGLFDPYQLESKCQKVECRSVYTALERIKQHYQDFRQKRFNFGLVSGYSNKGNMKWFKKCACGEFNAASQQCKVKGKSKEKPCCTSLSDCEASDAWPVFYQENVAAQNFRNAEGQAVQGLYQECIGNCHLRYRELCMEDLKEIVPVEGKSITRQQAFVLKTQTAGQRPDAYDPKYMEHAASLDRMQQKEKEERVVRLYAKSQKEPVELTDLSAWDPEFNTQSQQVSCCKCQKAMPTIGAAKVASFCEAAICPSSCQTAWAGFCSKRVTTCRPRVKHS